MFDQPVKYFYMKTCRNVTVSLSILYFFPHYLGSKVEWNNFKNWPQFFNKSLYKLVKVFIEMWDALLDLVYSHEEAIKYMVRKYLVHFKTGYW